MTARKTEALSVAEFYYPEHDALIRPLNPEFEKLGTSDCILVCGEDGELLLRNFTVEEAKNQFGMENRRVVIQCPTCRRYNVLAPAFEMGDDNRWVVLPRPE